GAAARVAAARREGERQAEYGLPGRIHEVGGPPAPTAFGGREHDGVLVGDARRGQVLLLEFPAYAFKETIEQRNGTAAGKSDEARFVRVRLLRELAHDAGILSGPGRHDVQSVRAELGKLLDQRRRVEPDVPEPHRARVVLPPHGRDVAAVGRMAVDRDQTAVLI